MRAIDIVKKERDEYREFVAGESVSCANKILQVLEKLVVKIEMNAEDAG